MTGDELDSWKINLVTKVSQLEAMVAASEKSNLERQDKIEKLAIELRDAKAASTKQCEDKLAYQKKYKEESAAHEATVQLMRHYKDMFEELFTKVYGSDY